MRKLFVCAAVLFACVFGAAAQDWSVSVGSELSSQYLWRGFDIAQSPTIVPTITLNYDKTFGKHTVGALLGYAYEGEQVKNFSTHSLRKTFGRRVVDMAGADAE